jgi:hypothetical protein
MAKKQNTRKPKSATKSATQIASGSYEALMKTLSGLQDKFEIPESAREFVKRGTATAKERAAAMHEGANKTVGVIETGIIDAVTGVAELHRKLLEAAHADTGAALAAIDKLAGAKSVEEAYQLYVEYWRERGEVGTARAQNAAAFVNGKISDAVKALQNGVAKLAPSLGQTA